MKRMVKAVEKGLHIILRAKRAQSIMAKSRTGRNEPQKQDQSIDEARPLNAVKVSQISQGVSNELHKGSTSIREPQRQDESIATVQVNNEKKIGKLASGWS